MNRPLITISTVIVGITLSAGSAGAFNLDLKAEVSGALQKIEGKEEKTEKQEVLSVEQSVSLTTRLAEEFAKIMEDPAAFATTESGQTALAAVRQEALGRLIANASNQKLAERQELAARIANNAMLCLRSIIENQQDKYSGKTEVTLQDIEKHAAGLQKLIKGESSLKDVLLEDTQLKRLLSDIEYLIKEEKLDQPSIDERLTRIGQILTDLKADSTAAQQLIADLRLINQEAHQTADDIEEVIEQVE